MANGFTRVNSLAQRGARFRFLVDGELTLNSDIALGLVLKYLDPEVVLYSLAADDVGDLTERRLSAPQLAALSFLVRCVEVVDLQHPHQSRRMDPYVYVPTLNDSLLRGLRQSCGGDLLSLDEGLEASDEAEDLLCQLVNRYCTDIKSVLSMPWPGTRLSCFGDPIADSLVGLLKLDEEISVAFPPGEDTSDLGNGVSVAAAKSTLTTAYGSMPFSEHSIPEALLMACGVRLLILGRSITPKDLREMAPIVLAQFRALVCGAVVEVPVAVSLSGSTFSTGGAEALGLEEGTREALDCGDGLLRLSRPEDKSLFMGKHQRGGLVWISRQSIRAVLHPADSSASDEEVAELMGSLQGERGSLSERWNTLYEAMILSLDGAQPPSLKIASICVYLPLFPYVYQSASLVPAQSARSSVEINLSQLAGVKEWWGRLSGAGDELLTSRRRLAMSFSERSRVEDSLVDAVVAWEAIFSGTPETQVRTTLPSSVMLAPPGHRADLAAEMRKTYALRSKLVHGKQGSMKSEDVAAARDRVVRWVTNLLRIIYTERRDLLSLDATRRSELILLEGHNAHCTN